jgi:ferredoxin
MLQKLEFFYLIAFYFLVLGFEVSNFAKLKKENTMAIIITDECINCGACEPECPNNAIYEASDEWKYGEGTDLTGLVVLPNGKQVDAAKEQEPISDEFYFIAPDKCTECIGFHEEPQCAAVCPVDCCVPDEDHVESEETLLQKKVWMHGE